MSFIQIKFLNYIMNVEYETFDNCYDVIKVICLIVKIIISYHREFVLFEMQLSTPSIFFVNIQVPIYSYFDVLSFDNMCLRKIHAN